MFKNKKLKGHINYVEKKTATSEFGDFWIRSDCYLSFCQGSNYELKPEKPW